MKKLIVILLSAFVISCGEDNKREKREFIPIEKIKMDESKPQILKGEFGIIELPKNDAGRVYYGPNGSLFPMIEFPTDPPIKFSE